MAGEQLSTQENSFIHKRTALYAMQTSVEAHNPSTRYATYLALKYVHKYGVRRQGRAARGPEEEEEDLFIFNAEVRGSYLLDDNIIAEDGETKRAGNGRGGRGGGGGLTGGEGYRGLLFYLLLVFLITAAVSSYGTGTGRGWGGVEGARGCMRGGWGVGQGVEACVCRGGWGGAQGVGGCVGGCVCGGGWGTALPHPRKSVLVTDSVLVSDMVPQLPLRGGVPDMLVTNSCPTKSRATNSVPQMRLRGGVGQDRLRACAAQLKRRPRGPLSHLQPPRPGHLQPPQFDTSDEEDADCGDEEGGREGGMGGDEDCGDKESELAVSSGMDEARDGGGGAVWGGMKTQRGA